MTKKYKLSLLLLLLIFGIGLFLRLYRLEQNVPELYSDEVGHYYYLENIKNDSVGLIRRVSYLFFTASWVVGLNPLGVRLASAIFGSLTILVGFYFARVLAKKSQSNLYLRVALVFSFLLSILPWNIAISRLGHTHVPIIVFTSLLHLLFYLSSTNNLQKILSFVPFLIGSYYYPTLILMSPLILFVPAKQFFWDNRKYRKQILLASTIFAGIILGFLITKYQIFNTNSRGLDLAIWRDVNVTANSNLYRGLARFSSPSLFSLYQDPELLVNKVFYNYPFSIVFKFTENYLSFFSPNFLFLKGDPVLRHSTGMTGNFYLFLLPFLVYGIYSFFAGKTDKNTKILIALWVLASPIPAAITKDGAGYLLRSISLYPLLTYFCAAGLVHSFEIFKSFVAKAIYFIVLSGFFIFSCSYYFYGYFHVYPSLAKESFEYGFKDLSEFQQKIGSSMLIIWEDKYPYNQFCFWQKLPFSLCDTSKTNLRETLGETRIDLPSKKIIFSLPKSEVDLELVVKKYQPEFIALSTRFTENYPKFFLNSVLEKTVINPDKTISFYIYQVNKKR